MKSSNKIYITLLIFALASLFLVVFFIWPLFAEIQQNSQDLISAKNSIVSLSAQTAATENFKKNYQTYQPDLQKIDQSFVDPNNPVEFIEFLENAASSSKVTSQVSLPPSYLGSQQFINLQFSSSGTFSGISNLLKQIEAGPYLLEIENLTIQKSQNKGFDATFTIKAFTKK